MLLPGEFQYELQKQCEFNERITECGVQKAQCSSLLRL